MKTSKLSKLLAIFCLIALIVGSYGYTYAYSSTVPSGNPRVKYYERPSGTPPYPERARFLILKGSWYEMGKQYGEGAGDYVRAGFDCDYLGSLEKYAKEHLWYDQSLWEKAIASYSPQTIEFIRGMADGAAGEFAKSKYKDVTNYKKALFLVTRQASKWRHSAWKHWPPECSGFMAGSAGVKNGRIIFGHNRDTSMMTMMWNVAYIAEPNDPTANKLWAVGGAGTLGYHFANDKGMAMSNH